MTAAQRDGGPAFPYERTVVDHGDEWRESDTGMTLRDYFAVHCDQPGVTEIVTAAGLHCPDNFTVWQDAETKLGTFQKWWAELPQSERLALYARVRYAMADALLAARTEQPE